MVGRRLTRLLLVVLVGFFLVAPSAAKIGYDIVATVGSSEWELHRSTQQFNFQLGGYVNGSGNFSKYTNIDGFGGVEVKERSSSTQPGRLSYEETMLLKSREGPVVITTELKSKTTEYKNDSTNESVKVKINESAKIEVDERWPTTLVNYKKLSYFGPGIRTQEDYNNNGDVVATSINSWRLSKESLYETHINRTVVSVNITSSDVFEEIFNNKSSRYRVNLNSVGSLTHLNVVQRAPDEGCAVGISQDYLGEEKMSLDLSMVGWVPPLEVPKEWLECCGAGDAEKAQKCSLTPSMDYFIFTP